MTGGGANQLNQRLVAWFLVFSFCMNLVVVLLVPKLLLLRGQLATDATRALLITMLVAGTVAYARIWLIVRKHRFVLRTLQLGSRSVEPYELQELGEEPGHIIASWLTVHVSALVLLGTLWRPAILDLTTSVSVALLSTVIVATSSLPLHVIVRSLFLRATELAPAEVMREVVEAAERSGVPQSRLPRRLLIAVATPVAFLALGSALIANAHLKRADERNREETARAIARAALELGPGVIEGAGLDDAVRQARRLGFSASVIARDNAYSIKRDQNGMVELITPLDEGSARMRFSGSTISVLSVESLLIALLAVALAGLLGSWLGRALGDDLAAATRGVRQLGTEAVLSGERRASRPPRFQLVRDLDRAVDRVADRFRVFARAQERAIDAREASARMRGLFFASVSHDLKSPLNAILGFTELVRQLEPLTKPQEESLGLIERRGRELLALIETILDAARVEAGQLTLVHDTVQLSELCDEACKKARDLVDRPEIRIQSEISGELSTAAVDRVQLARALATFLAHALKSTESDRVALRVQPRGTWIGVEVVMDGKRHSTRELRAMLDPQLNPGESQHRGLALALSLARSVVVLHGGSVEVRRRPDAMSFVLRLPGAAS